MQKIIVMIFLSTLFTISTAIADPIQLPSNQQTSVLAIQIASVISKIESSGYPLVTKIELTDGIFKVKAIDAQGLAINLEVDPQTGKVISPKKPNLIRLSILDAIKAVEAKDYHGIYKIEATNGSYTISAIDAKGDQVTLGVDANTGEVSKNWF